MNEVLVIPLIIALVAIIMLFSLMRSMIISLQERTRDLQKRLGDLEAQVAGMQAADEARKVWAKVRDNK